MPDGGVYDVIVRLGLDIAEVINRLEAVKQKVTELQTEVKAEVSVKGVEQVEQGMQRISRVAEQSKRSLMEQATALSAVSKKISLAGAAILGGLTLITASVAKYGARIADLTARTGFSAEALTRLAYAAEITESSIDALLWSIKFLERQLIEAQRGSEKAASRFNELGVAWRTASGQVRPVMDVLLDISDALSKLPSVEEKAGYAARVFGLRYGPALVPLLGQGRAELERILQTADRLKITFSTDAVNALNAFWDSVTTVRYALTGLGREFIVSVAPVLTSFAERLAASIARMAEFVGQNKALSRALFYSASALGSFMVSIGALGQAIAWFRRIRAYVGDLTNAFRMLGQTMASIIATPWGIITAALATVGAAILIVNMRADALVDTTRRFTDELRAAAETADLRRLREGLKNIEDQIERNTKALQTWIKNLRIFEELGRLPQFGILGIFAQWMKGRNVIPILAATVEAYRQMQEATQKELELLENEIAGRTDLSAEIRKQAAEYMRLLAEKKQLSEEHARLQANIDILNSKWQELGVTQDAVNKLLDRWNKELGEVEQRMFSLEGRIEDFTATYASNMEEIKRIAEEVATSSGRAMQQSISEIYKAVTFYIDALEKAFGMTEQEAIEASEQMFEAFRTTPEAGEAYENLISRIAGYMGELRSASEKLTEDLEELARQRIEAEKRFIEESAGAYEDYVKSVVDFANDLRKSFNLVFIYERARDLDSALSMINEIFSRKGQELEQIIRLQTLMIGSSYEELRNAVVSSETQISDDILSIARNLLEQLESINERRKALNEEYAKSLDSIRSRLIQELDRYYDLRTLVGMTTEELQELAERLSKAEFVVERPETRRERIFREQYERKRTFEQILGDLLDLQKRYVQEQEELNAEEARLREEALASMQAKAIDLKTTLQLLREDFAQLGIDFDDTMTKIRRDYEETLAEIDTAVAEARANLGRNFQELLAMSSKLAEYLKPPDLSGYGELSKLPRYLEEATSKAAVMKEVLGEAIKALGGELRVPVTIAVPDIGSVLSEVESLKKMIDALPESKTIEIKVIRRVFGQKTGEIDLRREFERLDAEGEFFGAYGP